MLRKKSDEVIKSLQDRIHDQRNKSSSSSLNKYGKSPYLQKISQGFSLPKKSQKVSKGLEDLSNKQSEKNTVQTKYDQTNHQRSRSNMTNNNESRSPKFRLPKIDVEHLKTDKKQKVSVNSLSSTLDASSKKRKLLPIHSTFRRQTVYKTRAGTNGKQTKINQDIAIIQNSLPHGVKLYCVCDGHGLNGHIVSGFIKQNLLKYLTSALKKFNPQSQKIEDIFEKSLAQTNDALLNADINTELSGSTVIAVFYHKEKLYSFNIGDSRAIIASYNEDIWKAIPLSDDQKPSRQDQKKRILEFGGRVEAQKNQRGEQIGPLRVWMKDIQMPGLAMTRSFGDKAGRKAGTNGDPEMLIHQINQSDKFLVVASDGVWEYLQNQQIMNIVVPFFLKNDIDLAADKVVRISSEIWQKLSYSRDDITLIIVSLNPINAQIQDSSKKKDSSL